VVTPRAFFACGPWVPSRRPAFPAPFLPDEGETDSKARAERAARPRRHVYWRDCSTRAPDAAQRGASWQRGALL